MDPGPTLHLRGHGLRDYPVIRAQARPRPLEGAEGIMTHEASLCARRNLDYDNFQTGHRAQEELPEVPNRKRTRHEKRACGFAEDDAITRVMDNRAGRAVSGLAGQEDPTPGSRTAIRCARLRRNCAAVGAFSHFFPVQPARKALVSRGAGFPMTGRAKAPKKAGTGFLIDRLNRN